MWLGQHLSFSDPKDWYQLRQRHIEATGSLDLALLTSRWKHIVGSLLPFPFQDFVQFVASL